MSRHVPDQPDAPDQPNVLPLHDAPLKLVLDLGALVSAVPYLARYTPTLGVAVLLVRDGRVEMTTVSRGVPSPLGASAFWRELAPAIVTVEAQECVIVVYNPADPPASPAPPATLGHPGRGGRVEALALAVTSPLPVVGLAHVVGDRWWDLAPGADTSDGNTDGDPDGDPDGASAAASDGQVTFPLEGRPVVTDEYVASTFIGVEGRAPAANRESLAPFLGPGPAAVRQRIDEALEGLRAELPHGWNLDGVPLWDPARARQAAHGWDALQASHSDRVERPVPIGEGEAVQLLNALSFSIVRDACMPWLDDAAWWLWTGLMQWAPERYVGNVGCLIAVAAYCRGDGATANLALERVLAADPDHRLAPMLADLISQAVRPDEVREMTEHAAGQAVKQLARLAEVAAQTLDRARSEDADQGAPEPSRQGRQDGSQDDGAEPSIPAEGSGPVGDSA